MLAPIKGSPPLGSIDFSPVILIILIQVVETLLIMILAALSEVGDNRKYQFHSEKSGTALSIRVIRRKRIAYS